MLFRSVRRVRAGNRVPARDQIRITTSKPRKKKGEGGEPGRDPVVLPLAGLPKEMHDNVAKLAALTDRRREIHNKYAASMRKYAELKRHHVSGAVRDLHAGALDTTTIRPVTVNKKLYTTEIVDSTKTAKLTVKMIKEHATAWVREYLETMLPEMAGKPFNETVFRVLRGAHVSNLAEMIQEKLEGMYADGTMVQASRDVRLTMC